MQANNHSGKINSTSCFYFGVSVFGNCTISLIWSSPKSDVSLIGMPSSFKIFQEKGWMTSLGSDLTVTSWPSRCLNFFSKPSSASYKVISIFMYRLSPTLLKSEWVVCLRTKMTSLCSMSGICSPCLSNATVSPPFIPGSTCTKKVLGS